MYFEDVLTFLQSSINPYLFVETLQIFLSNQSNVYYHMFVQIALGGGCIFTLVAFVWLFSTVSPQFACLSGCIITLVAFLHSVFSNVPSNCLPERMHNHTGCICLTFLHCVLSNVSSNCPRQWMLGCFSKTLLKKKLGRYPHFPLWGLYKAYPKAFFRRTSLKGHTT